MNNWILSPAAREDDDRPRQVRVRFTSEQAEYLKRMFELDAKPTTAAKDNMARKLGLPLRYAHRKSEQKKVVDND